MNVSQKQIAARPVITPTYKHFRMGVIVGGRVVEELKFLPGKAVTIGTLPGNDIQIADSPHAPLSLLLFYYESGERCQMRLGEGMTARVAVSGGVQELKGSTTMVLRPESDRGKVSLDDVTLIFQFSDVPALTKQEPKQPERKDKGVLGKCMSVLGR